MNEQEWLEWLNLSEELKKIQNIKDLAIKEEKELKNLDREIIRIFKKASR